MPVVHFTFWRETIEKWTAEGHITAEEADGWDYRSPGDTVIAQRLGFDFRWAHTFSPNAGLFPAIEEEVVEELPDGSRKVLTSYGATVLERDGAVSIQAEFDHLLKGRKEWEEVFLPRLQYAEDRITSATVNTGVDELSFEGGGLDFLRSGARTTPIGLFCGSLYGAIRNWLGLVNASYLQVDDPGLFDEIIDTVGDLCFECTRATLATGAQFDYGHFWEDICFKSGPLINPRVFRDKVGPHYARITDLLRDHGIEIVSLDCDGDVTALVPVWLENGVNTMFPVEVGTWGADIRPWRVAYGAEVRAVGGMDKRVFARDYDAVDAEIERLKPLVELGGYIPCPDHLIAPDARWENVQYYCDGMRRAFG
jgi:uroporphyrinogen decarboxylase